MDEARPGNLEIWEIRDRKNSKIKIIKIKISVAQNVGKVWIGRKQQLPAPFGAISGKFVHGPEKYKKYVFLYIFLGGPMGPIHPVWGNGCNISAATRI